MKIASVNLGRGSPYDPDFRSARSFVKICAEWFHKTFDLPGDVKAVTFVVHDQGAVDRFAFSVHSSGHWVATRRTGRRQWIVCFDCFTDWLRDKGLKPGKIYYAEVWY